MVTSKLFGACELDHLRVSSRRGRTSDPALCTSEETANLPNRILREGILESERIDKIGPMAELFYRRLMSVADDFGRYSCAVRVLLSRCFPSRPDWANEDLIYQSLDECDQAGLITIYQVGTHIFLEISGFNQQVRAKYSKYPDLSDGVVVHATQMRSICNLSLRSSSDDPSPSPSPSPNKESKKVEVSSKRTRGEERFEEFWEAYPRKVGKGNARKAYERLVRDEETHQAIIWAVAAQTPRMMASAPEFRPHPATWINGGRWDDEIEEIPSAPKSAAERVMESVT